MKSEVLAKEQRTNVDFGIMVGDANFSTMK